MRSDNKMCCCKLLNEFKDDRKDTDIRRNLIWKVFLCCLPFLHEGPKSIVPDKRCDVLKQLIFGRTKHDLPDKAPHGPFQASRQNKKKP